jgi:hypothetical protein
MECIDENSISVFVFPSRYLSVFVTISQLQQYMNTVIRGSLMWGVQRPAPRIRDDHGSSSSLYGYSSLKRFCARVIDDQGEFGCQTLSSKANRLSSLCHRFLPFAWRSFTHAIE